MGDNGELKKKQEEQKPEDSKSVLMVIEMSVDGKMAVHYPFLLDRVATYGFLKMAEKTLDRHYAQTDQAKVIQAKGNMINFIRGRR